ncbi:MAG: Mor transcription activator family protein [Candidatus Contendobacter sp.]
MRQFPLFDPPDLPTAPLVEAWPPLTSKIGVLVDALGWEGVLRLLRAYGGLRIYLPKPHILSAEHPLAHALGLETAVALCRQVGCSGDFDVPTGRNFYCQLRDRNLHAAHQQGASIRTLAVRFHLSERRVRRVLARGTPP